MSEDPKTEAGPEGMKKLYKDAGPEEARRQMKDDDTAGHRKFADDGDEQAPGPEGARRHMTLATPEENDTEAHKK